MITSVTGFASRKGQAFDASRSWDLRSVNGKGPDLRLRLPEWIDGLEQAVRAEPARRRQRDDVSLSWRLPRETATEALRLNHPLLDHALGVLSEVMLDAAPRGLILAAPSPAEVVGLRGVLEQATVGGKEAAPLPAALLADPAPVGRKLDFLTQEFNREANTVCAKAQHIGLTRIGLDLKTVIDQMREQVQNVE